MKPTGFFAALALALATLLPTASLAEDAPPACGYLMGLRILDVEDVPGTLGDGEFPFPGLVRVRGQLEYTAPGDGAGGCAAMQVTVGVGEFTAAVMPDTTRFSVLVVPKGRTLGRIRAFQTGNNVTVSLPSDGHLPHGWRMGRR